VSEQDPFHNRIRYIDYAALVRDLWGDEWKKPEVVYEFSNGRKFEDSGPNHGIYED
jgi:hypothetical protein